MTDFGITPTGFVLKRLENILAEIEADQLATISATMDVSADQPMGQINGIFSRQIASAWEALQAIHAANDPDAAEGLPLDSHGKLTGTERRPANYTIVVCTVVADIGTELLTGEAFAHLNGDPTRRFTPEADFIAPSTGSHTGVRFRAEETGAVDCPDGELEVIATPIVGWTSITNPSPGDTGHEIDDDATFRERREEQLTASGSATVDAIGADLLEIEGIEDVTMFNNPTNSTSADGLPPKSFEALVFDGNPATVGDNDIAQVIWDSMPAGIESHGSVTGLATDDNGTTQPVKFSRVTEKEIFIEYELETGVGYVGDDAVAAHVATRAAQFSPDAGDDVLFFDLVGIPRELEGVVRVVSMTIGFTASPAGTANLTILARELATFAEDRVTFV